MAESHDPKVDDAYGVVLADLKAEYAALGQTIAGMEARRKGGLIGAIANASKLAVNANTRIMALERVLEKEQPELHSAYRAELEELRRNPPLVVSLAGLEDLQLALVQDNR